MRLRGLFAGTAAAALLFGSAGYGIALARADGDGGARDSRSAAMHHDMTTMRSQMASEHGSMMRDPEMREMHRGMMRDPEMRAMHRAMDDSDAGSIRGHDMRGG